MVNSKAVSQGEDTINLREKSSTETVMMSGVLQGRIQIHHTNSRRNNKRKALLTKGVTLNEKQAEEPHTESRLWLSPEFRQKTKKNTLKNKQ